MAGSMLRTVARKSPRPPRRRSSETRPVSGRTPGPSVAAAAPDAVRDEQVDPVGKVRGRLDHFPIVQEAIEGLFEPLHGRGQRVVGRDFLAGLFEGVALKLAQRVIKHVWSVHNINPFHRPSPPGPSPGVWPGRRAAAI